MHADEEEFLRAGLIHYPKAARTVDQFKDLIFRRLDEALAGTASKWSDSGEKTTHRAGIGSEQYLEASRRVTPTFGVDATLCLGIGWKDSRAYVYAYCSEGPSWMLHPANHDASHGPNIERDRAWDYVWRACDPTNIAGDLKTILADFDRIVQPPREGMSPRDRRK
jgi:hypothetical protein